MVEVGSTIGNYEVLQKVGQGAMGAVYMARHPVIGKRVALKIIHPALATNEEMLSRFFNEARAVTQIGHPNIVDVQDFGQTPGGDSFIVMELLEGIGLGDLIRKEGQLSIERAVRIAAQLTDGLRAAHTRGIIHRDLKPDNIFLIPRGSDPDFVKILDFGLAKLTGPGAMTHKTRTGAVLGTAHYMAPEAAEDARKVDHRVDVYALGCILFQMVIGRVPFPGDGFGEVLVRQVREPPPLPTRLRADVPTWLEKIILHALAKKQEFRFASMEEFGRALRDPIAWERDLDDAELSDDEFNATAVRLHSTPPPMEAVRDPKGPSGPMRSSQIPADARTMSAALPAPLPDGTAELANPSGALSATERPDAGESSMVRRRTASALGVGATIFGVLALSGVIGGIIHHAYFSEINVAIVTEPPGVEIIVGSQLLGVSPNQIRLPRTSTAVNMLFQKVGYVSVRRSITATQDVALDVSLVAEPRAVVEPERPAVVEEERPNTAGLEPPGRDPLLPMDDVSKHPRIADAHTTKGKDGDKHARPPRPGKKKDDHFKPEGLLLAPTF